METAWEFVDCLPWWLVSIINKSHNTKELNSCGNFAFIGDVCVCVCVCVCMHMCACAYMHVSELSHIHTLNFLARLLVSSQISKSTLKVPLDWASSCLNSPSRHHVLMPCRQIPSQVNLFQAQLCFSHMLTFSTWSPSWHAHPHYKNFNRSSLSKSKTGIIWLTLGPFKNWSRGLPWWHSG